MMRDVRCPECNRLLFRLDGDIAGRLQIKCTCRRILTLGTSTQDASDRDRMMPEVEACVSSSLP